MASTDSTLNDRLALLDATEKLLVSEEQKRTLDRRIAELDADPKNVLTWSEIKVQIQGR